MHFLKSIFIMITSLITGLFADKSEIAHRPADAMVATQTLYDFKVKSLVGNETVDLSKYKGKKVVIWKYRAKQRYRRKAGQRAHHTRLLINSIDVPSAKKSRAKKSDAADSSEE